MARPILEHGNEPLEHSEVCIRVFERFFREIAKDDRFSSVSTDLYAIYLDILQEELAPFAAELALEVWSQDPATVKRRREREKVRLTPHP